MTFRIRTFLVLLVSAIAGICFFHNRFIYRSKSWQFVAWKSALDLVFLCLIAFYGPFLAVAYSTTYLAEQITRHTWQNRYWFLTLAAIFGCGLSAVAVACFEAVLVLSALPVGIFTGQILLQISQIRQKRLAGS